MGVIVRKISLLIVFLFCVCFVSATYISMRTQTTIDENKVSISVTNFGDEPARDVQISVELRGQEKTGKLYSMVGIAQTINETFEFDIAGMNGVYPLIITTEYADANAYPFSSIIVNPFLVGENVRSVIFGKIDPIELKEEKNAELVLKNLGEKPRKITLRIIVPKEITVENPEGTLTLDANEEGTLNIKLKRFSALVGSTYLIYAIVEYDENNTHYTSAISSTIKIIEDKSFKIPIWAYFVILALLVGVVVYFQFRKRK